MSNFITVYLPEKPFFGQEIFIGNVCNSHKVILNENETIIFNTKPDKTIAKNNLFIPKMSIVRLTCVINDKRIEYMIDSMAGNIEIDWDGLHEAI